MLQHGMDDRGQNVRPFFIHRLDPRVVLATWLIFIGFVFSVPKFDLTAVMGFAAFPIFLIVAGGLPGRTMLRRILLISPFILFMAAANPFLDKRPLANLAGLPITAGMASAAVIATKSIVSILSALTLVYCIPFGRLCSVLHSLKVPQPFVMQLLLVYRYCFLLADEARSLDKARQMRSFKGHGRSLGVTSKLIGAFMVRSIERSDRVYRAMVARGFNGTFFHYQLRPMQDADLAFFIFSLLLFLAVRILM
jgi:cobalt/nickel transport system permease protein